MAAARGRGGGGRSPPAVGAHPGPAQRQHAPRRARTPRAYRPLRRGRLEPPLVRLPELLLLPRLGVGTGPPRRPPPVAADARVAGDADPGDADRHPLRPAALPPRRHRYRGARLPRRSPARRPGPPAPRRAAARRPLPPRAPPPPAEG